MPFTDRSELLNFEFWGQEEFLHDSWGIGITDLDRNGHLDLYFNHHGGTPGEIIMNFASDEETHVRYEIAGDLHGATFFDIDLDGDLDLLQSQGGRKGMAEDPTDVTVWNRVYLNEGGVLGFENRAQDFGIEYSLGRKKINTPVNLDGQLAIYVGVLNERADGSFPGQLFARQANGRYEPIDPAPVPLHGPLVRGVHFGDDQYVDLVNLDSARGKKIFQIFENEGEGFGDPTVLVAEFTVTDYATGDFDGDLRTDILASRPGRRESLWVQDADGDWSDVGASATPPFQKNVHNIADGDFDNDGDLDYAALKVQDGAEVVTYLNRGDGTFVQGSRFFDDSIPGRGEYLFRGDFDRDGWLDLVVTTSAPLPNGVSRPGTYVYLEGSGPAGNNWLSIGLRGTASETSGLGARVYVTTPDGTVQVLEQDADVHNTAQNSTDLHFGLGGAAAADVRIVWADGHEQLLEDVAINRHFVIEEDRTDIIEGTAGNDVLMGRRGPDLIRALAGADLVYGGGGDDLVYGGSDDDRLFGKTSNDVIFGDLGRDLLFGGIGADAFAFDAVAQSGLGARRDLIRDYAAEDTIDLSGIDARSGQPGDQSFDFIGGARFSDTAGELRFTSRSLRGDVDGDGIPDFEIGVEGAVPVLADDITL